MRTLANGYAWSLTLLLILNACGGSDDEKSAATDNRVIQNPGTTTPSGTPGGDEDPNNDPNQIDLSQHKSLGIDVQTELQLPVDRQGFCVETNNNGTITSNAVWTLGPANVANVELTETNRCKPKLKLLNGYQETANATVTGRVPMPNNQVLSFVVRAHLRLAPAIPQPAAPHALNTNPTTFTGPQTNTPPFSGGPNYNGDGPKMRFCSSGTQRWFRDGNKVNDRHFGFMVEVTDPSPFEPSLADVTYSATCTPVNAGLFTNATGCSNFCPFEVEMVTINNLKYAKFSFVGSTDNVQNSQGNMVQIFRLTNGQCLDNDFGQTDVQIKLRATNPGGTFTKHVATLQMEVDPCLPY